METNRIVILDVDIDIDHIRNLTSDLIEAFSDKVDLIVLYYEDRDKGDFLLQVIICDRCAHRNIKKRISEIIGGDIVIELCPGGKQDYYFEMTDLPKDGFIDFMNMIFREEGTEVKVFTKEIPDYVPAEVTLSGK